ncbi:hypothetical protein MicvaDRAFT_1173 [Microcoleus vaginatus FGP-2]|nr:hypothetical protein MicvaDRAFT_1173 [Microcoleus vaginatus FGP-2]
MLLALRIATQNYSLGMGMGYGAWGMGHGAWGIGELVVNNQ